MKQIILSKGQVALVDDEVFDWLNQHLGCYETERDAALAYNRAAEVFYGEYACLNQVCM